MTKHTLRAVVISIFLALGVWLLWYCYRTSDVVTPAPDATSLTYRNSEYGFTFSLPATWLGYSIVHDTWAGAPLTATPAPSGPKILIRNPHWTAAAPYEDLPVLVFTLPEWSAYQAEQFSVSAAPILASELARNDRYVFALPPRWDFDYSLGYQEAEGIIAGHPLRTFNIGGTPATIVATNPKDATYTIDGHSVTLTNGVSIVPAAPNSATKVTTRYFGNEVAHDFDHDGRVDTAFILTQNTGGSGTFYYVVAALHTSNGYVGSSATLLGDRVAPQTTSMSQNPATPDVIIVNYADRRAGESFTTPPSVGKSLWLKLDPTTMQFGQVAQNFEGEADPSTMTLGMKTWNWVITRYNNDTTVSPKTNKFALTLKANKTFSATTDCNGVGGEYVVQGNKITFTKMVSTLMFCEGSQESDYSKMLSQVGSYLFTSKGELVFDLKLDTGTMTFK